MGRGGQLGGGMYVADASELLLEELDDGFERLGPEDTPFTLREGAKPREQAERIHRKREPDDRREDELSNEEVTRDIGTWADELRRLDFPFVDTVPSEELTARAWTVATEGRNLGFVSTVEVDADIGASRVKGRFYPGSRRVEVDADEAGFLGYSRGPTLAHEVGHAFHVGASRANEKAGFETGAEEVFETTEQRRDAIALSERLRGPIPESPSDVRSYRLEDEELFADVFASMAVEPEAARRCGPEAVGHVEGLLGELLPETVR